MYMYDNPPPLTKEKNLLNDVLFAKVATLTVHPFQSDFNGIFLKKLVDVSDWICKNLSPENCGHLTKIMSKPDFAGQIRLTIAPQEENKRRNRMTRRKTSNGHTLIWLPGRWVKWLSYKDFCTGPVGTNLSP